MTACTLCDLPLEDQPVEEPGVDGTFCCQGCLEIYDVLGAVDLDDVEAEARAETESEIPADAETTYLALDGMHCSTCEVFLETVARREDGVYVADASYAAEAIKVSYDPAVTDHDQLRTALSRMGYTARDPETGQREAADAISRLLVGGIFSMMAMTWYAIFLYPTYFGYDPIVELGTFDGAYLGGQLAVLTAIILLYTGKPMLRGAYVSLRTARPNVDLLVSIAALAAFFYSIGRLLQGGMDLYFDVTIVVVMAVTIGNYYEERIKRQTASLLVDLTELQVEEARMANGELVPIDAIEPGDRLQVDPGDRVPVDGTVLEGRAAVDESLVSGEPLPVTREPGDSVRGGTVVTDAPLVIEAADGGSTLDRIVDMLWDIQASTPGAQRVADRLSTVFVPLVLLLALAVSGLLFATGSSLQTAILSGLTVLIVSCPCALGLATPMAVASGLQTAASRGIVVTTPALFEHGDAIDTVVLDKTGTLTDATVTVRDVRTTDSCPDTVIERAAQLEQFSDHPIGTAIVTAATAPPAGTKVPQNPVELDRTVVSDVQQHRRGVTGTIDGNSVAVGALEFLDAEGFECPTQLQRASEEIEARGDSPVAVGWDGVVHGIVGVGDRPRPVWEAIASELGADRRVVVMTGDDGPAADRYREHPAIDEVFAGVPPDGKAAAVRGLTAAGTVAMVGDGSNDAPALAAADVGIAMGEGTKLASDAADAVVLDSDLRRIPVVFDVAGGTNRRIRENLAWAFVYNAIAIPLAVAGLINPLLAAVAMASSSLLVVANSARQPSLEALEELPADGDAGTSPPLEELPLDREAVS